MSAIDRLLKLADNEKYSIIDPQDIDDARAELAVLLKKEVALNVWLKNLEYDPETEGDDCATCQLYKTIKAIK